MDSADVRQRIAKKLYEEVAAVKYPSSSMLNRLEAELSTADDIALYADLLLAKAEATRFPGTDLLNRIDRVCTWLERAEQSATG